MESNLADDFSASQDDECVDSSGGLSPANINTAEMDKDSRALPVDGAAVGCPRPALITPMERLELKKLESAQPSFKGFTLPRSGVDGPGSLSTTVTSVRPLPKALQPKEIRRSSQPAVPTFTGIHKAATGHSGQLSSGVNVSDSVLRQQRLHSASGSATSPTAKSPIMASVHVFAKPEVVLERREAENVGRCVVREPNPGLTTLRAIQQQQRVTKETTKPYGPNVKVPFDNRHNSMSFSDILSVFESPNTTSSRPKPSSYIPTTSRYSIFKKFAPEVDEPIVNAEPIVDSVSVSNSEHDPSPTISKMLRRQNTGTVSEGQKRFETQWSCPEPLSVIQIRKSVTSPTAKEENPDDCVSTTSSTSDPIEISSDSVDKNSSSEPTFPEVESKDEHESKADADDDCSNVPDRSFEAATKIIEVTTSKATEDDEDRTKVVLGSDDGLNSDAEDTPPPLPCIPPPTTYLPIDLDDEDADHDEER